MKKISLYTLFLLLTCLELKPAQEPIYQNWSSDAPALPPRNPKTQEPVYVNITPGNKAVQSPVVPPRTPVKGGASSAQKSPGRQGFETYSSLPPSVPPRRESPSKPVKYQNTDQEEENPIYQAVEDLDLRPQKGGEYDNVLFITLMKFVSNGDIESVKDFLTQNQQFDLNIQDEDGNTALHKAAEVNDLAIVKLLLTSAESFYQNPGDSSMYLMNSSDLGDRIKELINIQNNQGKTALFYAVGNDNNKMVDLLLEKGADVTILDKSHNAVDALARENKNKEMAAKLFRCRLDSAISK